MMANKVFGKKGDGFQGILSLDNGMEKLRCTSSSMEGKYLGVSGKENIAILIMVSLLFFVAI